MNRLVLGAFSADTGRTFGEPVRLDDISTLGRVDVERLPDGSAVASRVELVFAWTESQDGSLRVRTAAAPLPAGQAP